MKTNLLRKSAIAVFTMTAASFYFAQEQEPEKENIIEEVVITGGVADIAKDRKTPVAVSTIKAAAIAEKLGNQEFPEMLNSTPSIYATKSGGGFGDSKISMRGFGNENIAVMVNGMPVNDMENGRVYWSNWSGISDVTSAMQVQRGLGASKLAIASVGGTINIITRAADMKKGGILSVGIANNEEYKGLFAYNTGKSKSGWSSSFLMGRTAGSKYAEGTEFEGYSYFFAVGYQPNEKHDFQFMITGAAQNHNQRSTASKISDYIKYGNGIDKPNRRYNADWGYITGQDGVRREFSWRKNFYHKPITAINWDWNISSKSKLNTVVYASFGRGGGTQSVGGFWKGGFRHNRFDNIYSLDNNIYRDADGQWDFDAIVRANAGRILQGTRVIDPNGVRHTSYNAMVRRASINSHDWYGIVSNFQHKINDNWNFSVGIDGRYYKGYHYQVLADKLGADGYRDTSNRNSPNPRIITETYSSDIVWNFLKGTHNLNNTIAFNNTGEVLWYGGFGQLEYSNDNFSAFVQGSVSNQGFQRIDQFIVDGVTTSRSGVVMNTKTGFKNLVGYNVKGGLNYNINENHNVFGNIGYYERQPFFNSIYRGNENVVSPNVTNEKIFGLELGYGLRLNNLSVNINAYRTDWKDVYKRLGKTDNATNTQYSIDINGLREIHQGIEVEASYKLGVLSLNGMFSIGDYFYKGNVQAETFGPDGLAYTPTGETSNKFNLLLDRAKVGETAQLTAAAGFALEPVKGLKFDANWRYTNNLYAGIDVFSFSKEATAKKGTLRLPSYNLFDLGLSYKLNIGNGQSFTFRGNVNNLFDTTYIAESTSNIHATDIANRTTGRTYQEEGKTYKGIATDNTVFFGFGRTWNASVSFNF